MAIHCEPVSEPHLSVRLHRMQWIAASVTSFSPRNDNELGVPNRLSHKSRSCHREGVACGDPLFHENRAAQSGCAHCMQWIAASLALASLLAMTSA